MRELTIDEMEKLLEFGSCPFCGTKVFRFGPRGGASQNIFCIDCGAGFNVCLPMFPAQLIEAPAEVKMTDRKKDPLRYALEEIVFAAEADLLHDTGADRNFKDSRQIALAKAALASA